MPPRPLFLDIDGNVTSCGYNENGQLGVGDYYDRQELTAVYLSSPVISVSGREESSLFLDTQSNTWSCGRIYCNTNVNDDKNCIPKKIACLEKLTYKIPDQSDENRGKKTKNSRNYV